jgi:hypothetical protein
MKFITLIPLLLCLSSPAYSKNSPFDRNVENTTFLKPRVSGAESMPSLRTHDPKIINPFIRRQQNTNWLPPSTAIQLLDQSACPGGGEDVSQRLP